MARNPDDDVAIAIARRWLSSVALVAAVPGGLEQDRLSEQQPASTARRKEPYATFTVRQASDPDLCTGGQSIHHTAVTIQVFGQKAAVSAALEILWYDPVTAEPVFVQQPLVMDGAVGLAAMAVLELGGSDEVKKDPATKDGAELWVGEHALRVDHHRSH